MNRAIVGATLTVLAFSLPAVAVTTNKFMVKGQTAYADFYQQNDECTYSSVGIFASDNVSKSGPGAPTPQKGANVYYSTYNWCTGEGSYSDGFASDVTFTSDNGLKSATLNGTVTLTDYSSGATKTVNVALTWTGTGDTYRGNSHSRYQGPGFASSYRYNGSYRDAQVSGSVTMDGKNLISNLSSYASLSSSNSGSVEIIRK
ncbi:MAG TPA: hypothetical protein DCY91_22135 [Cyanobacteria bacterium UBA11370]|nr:hypothetical protein [Cyanobacteria bacterium UBA11370]HBY79122.1 hypothetical protein [Cyanobacteria bacterium UBA11148]